MSMQTNFNNDVLHNLAKSYLTRKRFVRRKSATAFIGFMLLAVFLIGSVSYLSEMLPANVDVSVPKIGLLDAPFPKF